MLHLSQDDVEYLRPPQEATFVQHPPEYIKSGSEDDAKRAIFYGVDLDEYEVRQIEALKQEIVSNGITLNNSWNDRELLKYLYSTKFDIKKAVELLRDSLRWRTEVRMLPITDKTLEILHAGVVYPSGRDNLSRPLLFINLEKIDANNFDRNEMGIVLTFFFDSLRQYSFLQGKVENLVLIIDAADKDFTESPLNNIEFLIKQIVASYPCILDKAYIINASETFKKAWNQIKGLFEKEDLEKVQFLPLTDIAKLQEKIPAGQLESKYGGILPNLNTFWPVSAIGTQINPYGFNKKPLARSQIYEVTNVQTYERYTSNGVVGNSTYFDFDTNEQKRIYERTTMACAPNRLGDSQVCNKADEKTLKSQPAQGNCEENSAPEASYDLNDESLLNLIMGENEFIRGTEGYTKSADDSIYKFGLRNSHKKAGSVSIVSPNRDTQLTEAYTIKQMRESLNHVNPTYGYPATTDPMRKSNVQDSPNQSIEEWSKRKYLRPIEDREEEIDETKIEFCGLCVSNRRKLDKLKN